MSELGQRTNLGYLGIEFQYRLINSFFHDKDFFGDLNTIIDQNMFTDAHLRFIVALIKEYYAKYGYMISYDMLTIKINEKVTNSDDRQYYMEVIDKLKHTSIEGHEEIEEMAETFFKQQNIIKVANKLKEIASEGNLEKYAECQRILEEAMAIGRKTHDESHPFDNIDEDLSPESVTTIPTGIGRLDEILGGGLDKGKLGLIICPMGKGKALPDDELVATPNGFTEIKNINVGDYVIGSNGKPTMVTGVFPQGERDIYKVTFSDGVSCRCDREHLWTVNTWKQRHLKPMKHGIRKHHIDESFKTVKTLGELMDSGFRLPKKHNEHQFRIPMCQPVEYNERLVSIDPYLMGYMIGDGCFSRFSITIGKEDEENFEKQLKQFGFSYKISHYKNRATSIQMHEPFRRCLRQYYDVKNLKSDVKYIHPDYLYNSISNRIALLNGLMDSDGYVDKNGCCKFDTKSKQLAEDVKSLVLSLGGFASIRCKHVSYFNKKYNEKRDCGISYQVSLSLCDSSIPLCRYERKQNRVRYRKMKKTERYFETAEYVGKQNAICIKVDASDELFLTKDYIVTHNTSLTTCIAANAASYRCEKNNYEGYKVLQIVFEDMPRDLHRKYMAKLSQVESKDLSKTDNTISQVKELLNAHPDRESIQNNIIIKKCYTGEVKASGIKEIIKKKINEGFKPDVVIIDYFECIEPEYGSLKTDITEKEGRTMRKFENMAHELDIAIWIPTQGNRESINAEVVTDDKVGGSIRKNQIAQVVISIARSLDDMKNNKATIAVLKQRTGSAGVVLPVKFNNGTCTVTVDNTVDFDSVLGYNEYVEEKAAEKKGKMINEAKNLYRK